MEVIDLMALWIGRVVLFISVLILSVNVLDFFRFIFRRPYYSIKHLLPWKWKNEKEWAEFVRYNEELNHTREIIGKLSRYQPYYKFYRHKRIGIMINTGSSRWWEPKRRFFWIKKER